MALSENEKLAFEHIVMKVFHRTPVKITSYDADDISAVCWLQAPELDDKNSITLYAGDGKLRWSYVNEVKEYDRNFIDNLIKNDKIIQTTFKIEQ